MARSTSSGPTGSATEVVTVALRTQVADLRRWEGELRLHHPEAVHRYRVAARRLRSSLAAFRPVLEPDAAVAIARDLRRSASGISGARDAEAVRDRVDGLLLQVPEEVDAVRVLEARVRLGAVLDRSFEASRQAGIGHLDTPEYDRLVRRLEAFVDLPPWSAAASQPADLVLRRVLREEWARFRRQAVRPLGRPEVRTDEAAMHQARKASKRMRYVAETLEPAFGRRASRMAKAAARLQAALGAHRDSVITQSLLREIGGPGPADAEDLPVIGLMADLEAGRRRELLQDLDDLVEAADRKSLRRWLR